MVVLGVKSSFSKSYHVGWVYLKKVLNDRQFKIAGLMATMIKPNTNSLIPLGDETTLVELSSTFRVSRNIIKGDLKVLFDEGVYGRFEVTNDKYKFKKYWVFNPYLSQNGKYMSKDTVNLFSGTTIAKLST